MGHFENMQGNMLLTRHTASFTKLVYLARAVPPCLAKQILSKHHRRVREHIESLVGQGVSEEAWSLAGLGIARGGLGLRDLGEHSAAAYVASVRQTTLLAAQILDIDPARYTALVGPDKWLAGLAAEATDRNVDTKDLLFCSSQKALSDITDEVVLARLLARGQCTGQFQRHVRAVSQQGSGAWLTATPHARSWRSRTSLSGWVSNAG